ncbi:RloB family protein [Candidatus Enterococcus mansonii]|uniref:Abortive phage resistance protein n=1 Tax=Candidatus Enterococcus mansonii TaxID=1834181 RepID=A0A242CI03_9ENTE|nr:RloB family protein [Enterococcus sp. 4G2_DIV0659]OTO09758.1 hypothetical protein A5880_000439 [Enterococcus sp. 4G2_DIV0659]
MSRFSRKVETIESKPSIFIVCEGQQTEPNYFLKFPITNKTVKGIGYNTVSLVEYAIENGSEYDEIWCVFDEDGKKDQFDQAIRLCEKKGCFAAYTNEAFELWYLLHFNDMQPDVGITRKQYCEKLTSFLPTKRAKDRPKYCKNDETIYEKLLASQHTAISRAKKLLGSYPSHLQPSEQKPSTTVHLLVENLNKYL